MTEYTTVYLALALYFSLSRQRREGRLRLVADVYRYDITQAVMSRSNASQWLSTSLDGVIGSG